jgi:hypothetical protein
MGLDLAQTVEALEGLGNKEDSSYRRCCILSYRLRLIEDIQDSVDEKTKGLPASFAFIRMEDQD